MVLLTRSASDIIATLSNELSYYIDNKKGIRFSKKTQEDSTKNEKITREYLDKLMGTNKGIENDVVKFQKQVNQLEFTQRNKVAGDVFDVQPSINISEGILFKEISIELQLLKDVFIQKL